MPNYVSIKWIRGCDDEYWPFRSVALWTMECCPELISTAKKIMLIQQRFIKFPCFVIFFCMTQWSENYVCLGTKKAYDNAHLKPRELADYTWQEVLYLLHPGIHYTDNSQNKSIWTDRDTNYWGCSWVLCT